MQLSANPTTVEAGRLDAGLERAERAGGLGLPAGRRYHGLQVTGQGVQVDCLDTTTTYEIRVQLTDGTTQTQQVTVTVIQAIRWPTQAGR